MNRNIWGSVEAFAAAFVANVPTLFALRRRPSSHNSRPGSYCVQNNVKLSGFRQVEDTGIFVTRSIELEHKPSVTASELSSPRHWESWEKRDNKNDLLFVSRPVLMDFMDLVS